MPSKSWVRFISCFLNTKTHWRRREWVLKRSGKIRDGPLWFGGSNQLRSAGESLLKSFHRTFAVKSTLTAKSMRHQYVERRRFISGDSPVSRWLPSLILLPQFAALMRCYVAWENTGAKRIPTGINGTARSRLGPNARLLMLPGDRWWSGRLMNFVCLADNYRFLWWLWGCQHYGDIFCYPAGSTATISK